MLFGSIPSAIQATFTPAPVMPSDRAVSAPGVSESVWVSDRPSGASCGVVALQAPGITFGVSELLTVDARGLAFFRAAVGAGVGATPWMTTSGMTSATDGLAFSRAASPADTVAASAFTRR